MSNRKEFTVKTKRAGFAAALSRPAYLAECFDYDKATGTLTWRTRPRSHFDSDRGWRCFNTRDAGTPAGGIQPNGYLGLRLGGQFLYVHRIAWTIGTQSVIPPMMLVDHSNGSKTDNKFINLRLATKGQNAQNSKQQKRNPLPKGIRIRDGKYVVVIRAAGATTNQRFSTLDEACRAIAELRRIHHGEFANHGDNYAA